MLQIIGRRIQLRYNYSCTDDQDRTARGSVVSRGNVSQASIAYGLDRADALNIEQNGCSGSGAGARLMVTILDADDKEYETEYDPGIHAASVAALPAGKTGRMLRLAASLRRSQFWDGQNHVSVGAPHCRALWLRISDQRRAASHATA